MRVSRHLPEISGRCLLFSLGIFTTFTISNYFDTVMQETEYYSSRREEILPFIPSGFGKTLDVGCAGGYFSENLKKHFGVETWGIEMNEDIAKLATNKLDKVLTGSFECVSDNLPKQYFDCVFFNDVLEHMPYPDTCLNQIKTNLKEGGCVIASIPNVRHFEVVKELLFQYDWKYKPSGIMDRTHMRFFTKRSILRMFDECGYSVRIIQGINKSNFKTWKMKLLLSMPFKVLRDIEFCQYIVVASPKNK